MDRESETFSHPLAQFTYSGAAQNSNKDNKIKRIRDFISINGISYINAVGSRNGKSELLCSCAQE